MSLAPRAGLEPATNGLTVHSLIKLYDANLTMDYTHIEGFYN